MHALALVLLATALPGWTDAFDEDGIRMRYRDRADLGAREIEAEALIAASPERVFAVLNEPEKYVEFMPYVEKLEVLERTPEGRIQYEIVNPPVVSRRDFVVRVTVRPEPGKRTWRIAWNTISDRGPPPREDVVRVTLNEGHFQVEPHEGGAKLSYRLVTHPGGSIPAWVAKLSNSSGVPDVMRNVRRRAVEPGWKR